MTVRKSDRWWSWSKIPRWEGTQTLCSFFIELREKSVSKTKIAFICSAFWGFKRRMTYFVLHYGKKPPCLPAFTVIKSLVDKKICQALLLLLATVFERDSYIISVVMLSHGIAPTKSLCLVMFMFASVAGVETFFKTFNFYYCHNIFVNSGNSHWKAMT